MESAQLEREVRDLKAAYESKMQDALQQYEERLAQMQQEQEQLKANFEAQCQKLKEEYEERISALEEELAYSKEMNEASRTMMNDAFAYISKLEEELRQMKKN